MQDIGANRLCAAIICQAVKDYKLRQKSLLQGKRPTSNTERNGRSAEIFFRSPWFQYIANKNYDIDLDKLMDKIRKDAVHELRNRKKRKVFGEDREIG